MFTPGQRYEIGKQATEHGVTATLATMLRLPLSETSTQRFKDLYQSSLQQAKPRLASEDSNNINPSADTSEEVHVEEIKELTRKKQERPLLLPDALDHQVQEYVKDLCFQLMHR